jgi:Flp pilus assembly protein CpaB
VAAATTPDTQDRVQRPRMPGAPPWRRRRRAPGVAVPVIAGVLAVLVTLLAFRQQQATIPVSIATQTIQAGTAVAATAVGVADVKVPDAMRAQLLPAGEAATVTGWIATHTIPQGAPIVRSDLVRPAAAHQLRVMSIPVARAHAAGGEVTVGDQVDVIDSQSGRPVYAVTGAEVTGIAQPDDAALTGAEEWTISVAVDDKAALRLANAIQGAKFDVVRSTGAQPPADGAPVTTPEQAQGNAKG